uniref:Helicase-associated domain-containing protein n=1 Tax=Odontella aurita TaxID=265563 RepID=A0A7S4JW40_9STRA|mmetsp:Transcript_55630/g.166697  ORF Transcript_55630/g.166697 Transcript_55630/m.166697 type:complete len:833 (+) Transcript_55630:38-2536(+)
MDEQPSSSASRGGSIEVNPAEEIYGSANDHAEGEEVSSQEAAEAGVNTGAESSPPNQNSSAPSKALASASMPRGPGRSDGPSRRRRQRLPLNRRSRKTRAKTREEAASQKKAIHVKWTNKTIALGTFPVAVAIEKCTRAKELTAEWRKTMHPKPSHNWVMNELERLKIRVLCRDGIPRRKKVSAQNDYENYVEGSEDEDMGDGGDGDDVEVEAVDINMADAIDSSTEKDESRIKVGDQSESEQGSESEGDGEDLTEKDEPRNKGGGQVMLEQGSDSEDYGTEEEEDNFTDTASEPEVPPVPVAPIAPRLFSDPSDALAELYTQLDKSFQQQAEVAAELAEARRNFEDAKKWLDETEAQFQQCGKDVQTKTENMWEGELTEPCEWNEMYARLKIFLEVHGHTEPSISRRKKRKAKNDGRQKKRQRLNEDVSTKLDSVCGEELGQVKKSKDGITEREDKKENDLEEEDENEEESDAPDDGGDEDRGLKNWLAEQRRQYSRGKMMSHSPHRVRALEELGIIWDPKEAKWTMMLKRLKSYKSVYGHVDVPVKRSSEDSEDSDSGDDNYYDDETALGNWLRQQRAQYNNGIMKAHFPHHIQPLEQLGVVWDRREANWTAFFERLIDFKTQYGHTNVPRDYSDQKLFNWVCKQRSERTNLDRLQKGLPPRRRSKQIRPERLRLLEQIGFKWTKTWEDHFADLCAFCETNGHCNVPATYETNPQLAHWVDNQRKFYRRLGAMKKDAVTEDRRKMLDGIGFRWESGRKTFDERFQELLAFQAQFGHLVVPRTGEHKSLSLWLREEKKYFTKYQKGERSPITHEQIERLTGIGALAWKPMG